MTGKVARLTQVEAEGIVRERAIPYHGYIPRNGINKGVDADEYST